MMDENETFTEAKRKKSTSVSNNFSGEVVSLKTGENEDVEFDVEIVENETVEDKDQQKDEAVEIHAEAKKVNNPDMSQDINTMVNTIQETLVQSIHSFKRRIMKKIKRRINLFEGAIEEHIQTPLLTDMSKQLETLQIHLPIKEIQSFIDFDLAVSQNQEKIDVLKMIITILVRRSDNYKKAIANVLSNVISKSVQKCYTGGKGNNNLSFKSTFTYHSMRDVIMDFFPDTTSEPVILTELSSWLSRAADRDGGRKERK